MISSNTQTYCMHPICPYQADLLYVPTVSENMHRPIRSRRDSNI